MHAGVGYDGHIEKEKIVKSNPAFAALLLVLFVCNIHFVHAASPTTAPSSTEGAASEPTPTAPLPPGMAHAV